MKTKQIIILSAALVLLGVGSAFYFYKIGQRSIKVDNKESQFQKTTDSLQSIIFTQKTEYNKAQAYAAQQDAIKDHEDALIDKVVTQLKQSIKKTDEKIDKIPFNGLQSYIDSTCRRAGFGQSK